MTDLVPPSSRSLLSLIDQQIHESGRDIIGVEALVDQLKRSSLGAPFHRDDLRYLVEDAALRSRSAMFLGRY